MKLVLFSFALLCGVLLIHAEDRQNKGDHGEGMAAQPLSGTSTGGDQTKNVDKPAPESNSPDKIKDEHNGKVEEQKSTPSDPPQAGSSMKTTSPKPTTTPAPYPGGIASWNVTDPKTNVTCIMVSGIITVTTTLKNYEGLNGTRVIALGSKTPANGSCIEDFIRWDIDSNDSSLQFKFSINASSKDVYLSRVDGRVVFSGPKGDVPVGFNKTDMQEFEAPQNKSYYCGKTIKLPIVEEKERIIVVQLDDFKIQARNFTKNGKFDESIDGCPSHSGGGPDVIPIIVGCMLAVLVVVVLVAYLINRRRSQAHGYLSM